MSDKKQTFARQESPPHAVRPSMENVPSKEENLEAYKIISPHDSVYSEHFKQFIESGLHLSRERSEKKIIGEIATLSEESEQLTKDTYRLLAKDTDRLLNELSASSEKIKKLIADRDSLSNELSKRKDTDKVTVFFAAASIIVTILALASLAWR